MAKYNLLIIEDHSLTRFGLKTAFENDSSYTGIYEAANAKDGLEIADKKNIDIIISCEILYTHFYFKMVFVKSRKIKII